MAAMMATTSNGLPSKVPAASAYIDPSAGKNQGDSLQLRIVMMFSALQAHWLASLLSVCAVRKARMAGTAPA